MKKLSFFLMAMLVSLTSFAEALGDGYEKVTNISTLAAGDKVVLYADDISKGVTGWSGSKDATVAESGWVKYLVEVTSGGVYLKDENVSQYIASPGTSNVFKYGTKAICTVDANGVLECNSRFLCQNNTYYRMYTAIGSYKPFYVYKVVETAAPGEATISVNAGSVNFGTVKVTELESVEAKTLTVTGTELTEGITVSLSDQNFTTDVTELPKEGGDIEIAPATNLVPNTYETTLTLTSGTTTQTVTLSINVKDVYTITWNALGTTTITTVVQGDKLVLPEEPTCDYKTFVGWATEAEVSADGSDIIFVNNFTIPTTSTTYYAVFAVMSDDATAEKTGTYTIADYAAGSQYAKNEEHKLDDDVTIYTSLCHFTTELRIYSSGTNNGYVISNELPGAIKSMSFNAGNKADNLVVYGSTDGSEWFEVGKIATKESYADYTLSFGETNYTYFKLDVEGTNQIRIKKFSITYLAPTYTDYSTTCEAPAPTVITETFDLTQEKDTRNQLGTYVISAGDYTLRIYGYNGAGTYQDDPTTEEDAAPLLFIAPNNTDALDAVVVVTIDEENNKEVMQVTATSADGKKIYNLTINIALPSYETFNYVATGVTAVPETEDGFTMYALEGEFDNEGTPVPFELYATPEPASVMGTIGEEFVLGEGENVAFFIEADNAFLLMAKLQDDKGNIYNIEMMGTVAASQDVEIVVAKEENITLYNLNLEVQGSDMATVSAGAGNDALSFWLTLLPTENYYGGYMNDAFSNIYYGEDQLYAAYGDMHLYGDNNGQVMFVVSFITKPDAEGNVTKYNFKLYPGDQPVDSKHTVTILVTPEGAGTVTGAGEYEEGTEVTLTATPAEGYEFVNWTVGDSIVSTANPYTFTVTEDLALVANFKEKVVEEPTYEVFKDTITDLAFDTEAWPMACTGGPSAQYSVEVYLLFYAEPNANGAYDLTAESSVTINGIDATFIEGYLENVVVFGDPKADAVIRCQWNRMNIELHLAMSASATPVTAIEIEAEDAKVEITEYEAGFDGAKAYELKVTADWINEADELTYAVEVLIPEFDPTVAVGEYSASLFVDGEGDAFGRAQDAEVSVVVDGGNIIVEGYGIKAFNENVYDIYLSGKMPVSEPTKHTVTILVTPEGAGTVTGAGEYKDGASVTVTATENEGYMFVGWMEDGEFVSDEYEYTFQVLDDVTLIAYYLTKLEGTSTNCVINGNTLTATAQLSVGLLKMNLVLGEEEEEGVFVVTEESKLTIGDEEVILENGRVMVYAENLLIAAFLVEYQKTPYYIAVMILNPTTGVDNINTTVVPVKMIENGQLIIMKGDTKYNVQGAIIK